MYTLILTLVPMSVAEQPKVVEFGVPPIETRPVEDRKLFTGGSLENLPVVPYNSYGDVYERVKAGERLVFTAPLIGFSGTPGTYEGFLDDSGRPVMIKLDDTFSASSYQDLRLDCGPVG